MAANKRAKRTAKPGYLQGVSRATMAPTAAEVPVGGIPFFKIGDTVYWKIDGLTKHGVIVGPSKNFACWEVESNDGVETVSTSTFVLGPKSFDGDESGPQTVTLFSAGGEPVKTYRASSPVEARRMAFALSEEFSGIGAYAQVTR